MSPPAIAENSRGAHSPESLGSGTYGTKRSTVSASPGRYRTGGNTVRGISTRGTFVGVESAETSTGAGSDTGAGRGSTRAGVREQAAKVIRPAMARQLMGIMRRRWDGTGTVVVVENFFEELRAKLKK